MITKTHAQTRAHEAAERVRTEVQLQIDTYFAERDHSTESAAMVKIFDQVIHAIKSACDKGDCFVLLSCLELFGDNRSREITRRYYRTLRLLQELEYTVDFSWRSKWEHEQLTVMW